MLARPLRSPRHDGHSGSERPIDVTHTPGLTVRDHLQILRRRRVFIVVVTLVVTLVGSAPALLESPTYAASADILIGPSLAAVPDVEESAQNRSRELATVVELLQSREMQAAASERLGADAPAISSVQASLRGFTDVVRVRVVSSSPGAAADAANALADVYVEQRLQQVADAQADAPADAPGPTRATTTVVSRAVPSGDAVSPHPRRSAAVAFAVGLLVAVGGAAVLEIVQDRLPSAEALDAVDAELPLLGTVPHLDRGIDDPGRRLSPAGVEAFRYLWTALGFRAGDDSVRSLVITSATRNEGRTTVAVHLARAAADSGARVMVIDADLRHPALHERMGLGNEQGLTSVLRGERSLADVAQEITPSLSVITAGDVSSTSPERLGGEPFRQLLEDLARDVDLVVIDVPPLLPVVDALQVAGVAGAAVVVGRIGHVSRRDVVAATARFRHAPVRVLGFVANDDPVRHPDVSG